jgi:hypothetical protein
MQPAYMLMQKWGNSAALMEGEVQGEVERVVEGEVEGEELDLSRRGLRSGSSGGGMAFTRVMRDIR